MDSSPDKPPQPTVPAHWLAAMADALIWPLMLVDADGRLLHGNGAAHTLLARQRPLRLTAHQRIAASSAPRQAALLAALSQAAMGDAAVLHWGRRETEWLLSVRPLAARVHGSNDAAVLMLACSLPRTDAAQLQSLPVSWRSLSPGAENGH